MPMRHRWRRRAPGFPETFAATLTDAREVVGPLVEGRSVALVGNAASLLANPPTTIDDHDVVVRINRGQHVAEAVGTIGTRTDMVLLAGGSMAIALAVDRRRLRAPAPVTVFMENLNPSRLPRALLDAMCFYPPDWHAALREELGTRPSTGAKGIDLLSRLIGTGSLHLYGFDFWQTPTTYNDRLKVGPHAPSAERALAEQRVGVARIHRPGGDAAAAG